MRTGIHTVVTVEVAVISDVMLCDVDTFCRETELNE